MAKPNQPAASEPSRVERILAYMFASAIGLSIIAIVLVLIAAAVPFQLPPVVAVLPVPGLAFAFIAMIALIIITARRRGRESKDARS